MRRFYWGGGRGVPRTFLTHYLGCGSAGGEGSRHRTPGRVGGPTVEKWTGGTRDQEALSTDRPYPSQCRAKDRSRPSVTGERVHRRKGRKIRVSLCLGKGKEGPLTEKRKGSQRDPHKPTESMSRTSILPSHKPVTSSERDLPFSSWGPSKDDHIGTPETSG